MDSFKKFSDKQLPDRSKFFNSLKTECISQQYCLNAIDIWNMLKRKAMGYYHDVYLKTDVLLLADVFEKFINTCLEYYGLDTCHYFNCPGLSCDAMLKMTEIELEPISDIGTYLFVEKEMREGITYITKSKS